jgi:hypothetical protein
MPLGDRTGPMGGGPKTGRGAGFCGGNEFPGYAYDEANRPGRFGRKSGCFSHDAGGGHGYRHWFQATGLPAWIRFVENIVNMEDDEIQILKSQAEYLNRSLEAVKKRLSEIKEK